jgi:pantoate ligase / CMP/dCMP kinase
MAWMGRRYNGFGLQEVPVRCFRSVAGLRQGIAAAGSGLSIGFVPTMGALHAGHRSLIDRARRETDVVVVSIFVNPLQFGPTEDLAKYPRPIEADRLLCEQAGVDVLFLPEVADLYGAAGLVTEVEPPEFLTQGLCGRSRPGHFRGVATVVTKLLNIVGPSRSYFGDKDAQQVAIVRRLALDLNLPGEIVGCPIVREPSGLALSSRNQYLSAAQRDQATALHRGLQVARSLVASGERDGAVLKGAIAQVLRQAQLEPDYIELVDPVSLAPLDRLESRGLLALAAKVGAARLIDNMVVQARKPIIAIDGPAGAGKSTVTRQVAQQLGLIYLDTGAMYRAVTWLALESGVPIADEPGVTELLSRCQIDLAPGGEAFTTQVWVNGQDVTEAIRTPEVTAQVSAVSAQPEVRRYLLSQQQRYGDNGGLVAEGRDIGTTVFPDAELKIFLTASVEERARRRCADLIRMGREADLATLTREIADRDHHDSTRAASPLVKAEDAIELVTDGLTIAEVVQRILSLYEQRL